MGFNFLLIKVMQSCMPLSAVFMKFSFQNTFIIQLLKASSLNFCVSTHVWKVYGNTFEGALTSSGMCDESLYLLDLKGVEKEFKNRQS